MTDIPFTADELRRMLNEQDAEIDRLRATNERLRGALHIIAWEGYEDHDFQRIARATLAQEKPNDR